MVGSLRSWAERRSRTLIDSKRASIFGEDEDGRESSDGTVSSRGDVKRAPVGTWVSHYSVD